MVIKIAKHAGFCFGVKRAIQIATDSARVCENIVTLGPLIHNPQMVAKLREMGIDHVDTVDDVKKGDTVIVRSHGIPKPELERLRANGNTIIDATCPYVSKTQENAKKLREMGFEVVILGDGLHPEVIALQSYVDNEALVVNGADELPSRHFPRMGIISQTTQVIENYQQLVYKAVPLCEHLYLMNTICNATSIRQEYTEKLASESDLMIVVGGRNSSNTKMLARISTGLTETHHIETADELDPLWLGGKENIGISAGASTPDWIILDVYNRIKQYKGNWEFEAVNVEEIPGYKEE